MEKGEEMKCATIPEMTDKQTRNFFKWIDKNGPVPSHVPEIGNCWQWIGAVNPQTKYAVFGIGYKTFKASRVSFKLHVNDPEQSLVLHKCDNTRCVNPFHLFLGGHKENMDDCVFKGRKNSAKGERHASAKLTPEQIPIIRDMTKNRHALGVTMKQIADSFGVDEASISAIHHNRTWRHVPI